MPVCRPPATTILRPRQDFTVAIGLRAQARMQVPGCGFGEKGELGVGST